MSWQTIPTVAPGTDQAAGVLVGDAARAKNRIKYVNGRLLGCATGGAEGLVPNALGILTTAAAPNAGEVAIPNWWGKGQGSWKLLDEDLIDIEIHDGFTNNYACTDNAPTLVDLVSITNSAIAGTTGDLTFRFFNNGPTEAGPLAIILTYVHSEVR